MSIAIFVKISVVSDTALMKGYKYELQNGDL